MLLGGRKVAGILVEGRPQERWAVAGIGLNVALRAADLPLELRDTARRPWASEPDAIEPTLARLLTLLERWLSADREAVLDAVRGRDALLGNPLRWSGGSGHGAGVDDEGRLLVLTDTGQVALEAGEVHLEVGG